MPQLPIKRRKRGRPRKYKESGFPHDGKRGNSQHSNINKIYSNEDHKSMKKEWIVRSRNNEVKSPLKGSLLSSHIEEEIVQRLQFLGERGGFYLKYDEIQLYIKMFLDSKHITSSFKENYPPKEWTMGFVDQYKKHLAKLLESTKSAADVIPGDFHSRIKEVFNFVEEVWVLRQEATTSKVDREKISNVMSYNKSLKENMNVSRKEEECPPDLKTYLGEIDINTNKIESSAGEIQNGHLLALFFSMKKQKSVVFQKFYDILKKNGALQMNGDVCSYNKVYSKCYCIVNKYNSLIKKGKRYSTICASYVKSAFTISIRRLEETKSIRTPKLAKVEEMEPDSSSTSSDFLTKESEDGVKEESDNDIYERYFDLISQKIDAESKNEKLSALMEDAMSKLHDAELHTHKLNTALADLREELKMKSQMINKLESKLKLKHSPPGNNTAPNDALSSNDDLILKMKAKNKHMRDILKEKVEVIRVLKLKLREVSSPEKKEQKPRGRRKKVAADNTSNLVKERFRKTLEEKINHLIKERSSARISEMLLESFPDISISDFEVILKVLTDSNALLEQRIIHKWNVDGEDVTYYGIIKENLINQKKFYITYWEDPDHEQQSDDYEIVEYNSLIADIILKDLTFTDPCSLF